MNYERATMLLDFIETASKHGPAFSFVIGQAQAELKAMCDEAKNDTQSLDPADEGDEGDDTNPGRRR